MNDMACMLGWLDRKLPFPFYTVVGCRIVLAVLLDAGERSTDAVPRRMWLTIGLALMTIGSVFGALYLAWTPIGADVVDSVQARYLLLSAMLLAVSVPIVSCARVVSSPVLRAVRVVLCFGFAAVNLWIVPFTRLHRYDGQDRGDGHISPGGRRRPSRVRKTRPLAPA